MRQCTEITNHLSKYHKSGEKSCLERALLEIKKCMHQSHENERANEEAWFVENTKWNSKNFFKFAKETTKVCHKIGPRFQNSYSHHFTYLNVCNMSLKL